MEVYDNFIKIIAQDQRDTEIEDLLHPGYK